MDFMDFLVRHSATITLILFLISELLGENEKIRANSVFGAFRSFLKGESLKVLPEVEKHLREEK
jgi:hypothetical protein